MAGHPVVLAQGNSQQLCRFDKLENDVKQKLKDIHNKFDPAIPFNHIIIEGFAHELNQPMLSFLHFLHIGNPYPLNNCMSYVKKVLKDHDKMMLCAVWWTVRQNSAFNRIREHVRLLYNKKTQNVQFQCEYTFFSEGLQNLIVSEEVVKQASYTHVDKKINEQKIKHIVVLGDVVIVPMLPLVPIDQDKSTLDQISWFLRDSKTQKKFDFTVYLVPVENGNSDLFYICGNEDDYSEYLLSQSNLSTTRLWPINRRNSNRARLMAIITLTLMVWLGWFTVRYYYVCLHKYAFYNKNLRKEMMTLSTFA